MNTIFIVGSSSGIGKATAKLFAEKGWTVIATMRTPEKETELTSYDNVHLYPLDVTNPEQIAQTVSAVHRFFVHGTTPRALTSLTLSLPASRKRSFPVR